MGMFDHIRCQYPLPLEGANALEYQSTDTPAQSLDNYEIRADGTLWHEDYDIEDQSEIGAWQKAHPGEDIPAQLRNLGAFFGCIARINPRWEQVPDFSGNIEFYARKEDGSYTEWCATFHSGRLVKLGAGGETPTVQPAALFEAVDHTDPETYWTLGIWPTLGDALEALATPHPPRGDCPDAEEYVEVHIHERRFGSCGIGDTVAKLKWREDPEEGWQFLGTTYCDPANGREIAYAPWVACRWQIHDKAGEDLFIDAVRGDNGTRFAVRDGRYCLSHNGDMDYEPMPSSRTDEWIQTHRWNNLEEAKAAAQAYFNTRKP